ncbi:MAG TPA: sigma-70 family RNA polymerase sigma factor [Planctomycetota bacterium]|nr:sigma-70 family RNA polymerase sigma factor [Planctomycetota bacterium]
MTLWTLVRGAARPADEREAETAWHALIERYREPVARALARRLGPVYSAAVPDEFFSYLFMNRLLQRADPRQGRFRCFVQGILRNFAHSYRRSCSMFGSEIPAELATRGSPESDLERADELDWARSVLGVALEQLGREDARSRRVLVEYYGLLGAPKRSTEELAGELGCRQGSVHVALHRARQRFEAALRHEVEQTVSDAESFASEYRLVVDRLQGAFGAGVANWVDGIPPDP